MVPHPVYGIDSPHSLSTYSVVFLHNFVMGEGRADPLIPTSYSDTALKTELLISSEGFCCHSGWQYPEYFKNINGFIFVVEPWDGITLLSHCRWEQQQRVQDQGQSECRFRHTSPFFFSPRLCSVYHLILMSAFYTSPDFHFGCHCSVNDSNKFFFLLLQSPISVPSFATGKTGAVAFSAPSWLMLGASKVAEAEILQTGLSGRCLWN